MKWLIDWIKAYRFAFILVFKKGAKSGDVRLEDVGPDEVDLHGAEETSVDKKGYIHKRWYDPEKQEWEEIK
jgi:hypothetical protein